MQSTPFNLLGFFAPVGSDEWSTGGSAGGSAGGSTGRSAGTSLTLPGSPKS